MAAANLSDGESSEKLLKECNQQPSEHADDETNCIQLLLSALEAQDTEDNENDYEHNECQFAGKGNKNTEVRFKENNKDRKGRLVGSESDLNINKLKLDIPTNNYAFKVVVNSPNRRPSSARVLDRHTRAMKLLKQHKSETGKAVCGVFIFLLMVGSGSCLLALAWFLHLEDLYILGGIFALGGFMFLTCFVFVRCQASEQMGDTDYSVLYQA